MSSIPRFECADVDPSPLGQPLHFPFSGRTAPNRFLKGAMSERLASFSLANLDARGIPTPALVQFYKCWGEGQVGLNVTGNVMIDPNHLETAGNLVIPHHAEFFGERFDGFQELALASKANGSLIIAQVGHPGRQTSAELQPHPISASDVQVKDGTLGMSYGKPRAATKEDIRNIIDGFAHAAEYLDKVGYDGIQLHAAYGYLLSQFLPLTTNLRTDQYGRNLTNWMRLILEIRDEISRRVRKEFVVGIKINSVEFQTDGFQPSEAKDLCEALEQHAFNFVELSGGTYENWPLDNHKRASTLEREAFFLQFAKHIVPGLTKTKTYVTGGLKTVEGMVKALDTVDGVGIARALCQEPNLCAQILSGEIKGAILQKLNMQDFGATLGVAGLQITQMGQGMQPINLSLDDNVAKAFGALGQWLAAKGKNLKLYQFPLLSGYDLPASATV